MTLLTRRETTGLLLAGTAAAVLPSSAAAEKDETLAIKLAEALNGRLQRGCGGTFSVRNFRLSGTRTNVIMRAGVALEWPPGKRVRPFRSFGGSQQEAIVHMFYQALDTFNAPWPECVNNARRN